MSEPDYYAQYGLSPIGAMKQGLISREEYIGFLKGNIIKYTVRAGHKEDAIKDLKKAQSYIDFYLELLNNERIGDIKVNVEVNNDIDWDKLKENITDLLGDANSFPVIMETPTEDPHIMKLNLSDIMYNRDGELKPEAREKIKEYLINRREKRMGIK